MSNHPNRSKANRSTASTPTPSEIRGFRESHKLTTEQAGALVHVSGRQWQKWELGPEFESGRAMHPAFFELARIKLELATINWESRATNQTGVDWYEW